MTNQEWNSHSSRQSVETILRSSSATVRSRAATQLISEISDGTASPEVLRPLLERDDTAPIAVLVASELPQGRAVPLLASLASRLAHQDPMVRYQVADCFLASVGGCLEPDLAAPMMASLEDENAAVRERGIRFLAVVDSELFRFLVKMPLDPVSEHARSAVLLDEEEDSHQAALRLLARGKQLERGIALAMLYRGNHVAEMQRVGVQFDFDDAVVRFVENI